MGSLSAGFRLAVGTLTVVPVGTLPTIDRYAARAAMLLAPVAAVPVAALAGGVAWAGGALRLPSVLVGALVCAALGWGMRAMHWDGLADTADGLAAGWDRERALAVMRRGDVGPVGAAVLGLALLMEAVAFGALAEHHHGWLVVASAVVVSRAACPVAAWRGWSAARSDGLGVVVAGSVPSWGVFGVAVLVAALLGAVVPLLGLPWFGGVAVALLALAGTGLFMRRCVRVFGGVTGDVLGAAVETTLVLSLVLLFVLTGVASGPLGMLW